MLGTESPAAYRIDNLKAPLFVSWQITRDCDLSCVHCCTGSAPGKRLPDELNAEEALRVAEDLIRNDVPYVMLCGGEPLVVPHFMTLADRLGNAGVQLKIETNGQQLDDAITERLARTDGALRADQSRRRYAGCICEATTRRVAAEGARGLPQGPHGRLAARSHLCADPPQYSRSAGRDRAGGRARSISLQHRPAHAHRYGGASMGESWHRARKSTGSFTTRCCTPAVPSETRGSSFAILPSRSPMRCAAASKIPPRRCSCCPMVGSRSRRHSHTSAPIYAVTRSRNPGRVTGPPGET